MRGPAFRGGSNSLLTVTETLLEAALARRTANNNQDLRAEEAGNGLEEVETKTRERPAAFYYNYTGDQRGCRLSKEREVKGKSQCGAGW